MLSYAGLLVPVALVDGAGNAQGRQVVDVLNVDGTTATVYADAARTALTGAVASDATGNVSGVYAEPGVYRLRFSVLGVSYEVQTVASIDPREITDLHTLVTGNSGSVSAEATARTAADSAESSARAAADSAEAALRASGDTNETNTRAAADAAEAALRASLAATEAADAAAAATANGNEVTARAAAVLAEQNRAIAAEAANAASIASNTSAVARLTLTTTATKTAAYTAVAGDLIPVSTAGGPVTVTLPAAPATGTLVAVKHTVQGGTNVVTIAAGGTDHFNTSTGPTTATLTLLNQAVHLQYAGGVWLVVADDLPLSQLDARFLTPSAAAGAYRSVAQCLDAGVNPLGDAVELAAKRDSLPAAGGTLALGRGRYDCPAGLSLGVGNKGVTVVGHGGLHTGDASTDFTAASVIVVSSATATGLAISGSGTVLQDFAVVCTHATPTAGAGIAFSSANQFHMSGVTVAGFYDLMTVDNGWFWKVDRCNFFDPIRYALYQTSTTAAYSDHADAGISNCIFAMARRTTNATSAFRWEGGAGIRWNNNKIVGQNEPNGPSAGTWVKGIDIVHSGGSSGGMEIEVMGGGISNCTTACLSVTGSTNSVSRVTVTGLAFQGLGGGNTTVGVSLLGGTGTIHTVTIADNTFVSLAGGGIVADTLDGLTIGTNTWTDVAQILTLSGVADTTGVNTRQVAMAVQNFGAVSGVLPANVSIVRDRRAIYSSTGGNGGKIDLRYTASLDLTSVGTWVTVFSIRPHSKIGSARSAGIMQVDVAGADVDATVGAFHRRIRQGYLDNSNTMTIPTATEDVTISNGTPHLSYRVDNTTSGVLKFQVQLTTGGTHIGAKVHIDVLGFLGEFALGDCTSVTTPAY